MGPDTSRPVQRRATLREDHQKLERRSSQKLQCEALEDRQLLTASLQPITSLTVPAQQGAVIQLLAQSTTTDPQTFTVTSSQPNVVASVVQGQFWTLGISTTTFTGTLTFQLFPNLTPNTVTNITNFTNDNYYPSTGKYFARIVNPFGSASTAAVVHGGANSSTGGGPSGQPGTPFANENVQQLIFNGTDQLAMANSGGTDTNDTQFFITTGSVVNEISPAFYGYTIFGELVSGQNTLAQMAALGNPSGTPPTNPVTITSTTLTNTNPNGVLIIDASHTQDVGEQATITVTAHDAVDNTNATQSFTVTIAAYSGPTDPVINFAPFANPTSVSTPEGTATSNLQLNGASGYPDPSTPATLTYSLLSQPSHGTVTDFNASTGTFTYTPDKGFLGSDTFNYQVTSTGPEATPATLSSLPGVVSIAVGPVATGAVQVIGQALVITPLPQFHGKNVINIAQIASPSSAGGAIIQVEVNGELDSTQPAIGSIDRIIVFGGRTARNKIIVDPSVQLSTTIDSGHGTFAYLTGGGGPTREHGWFGNSTLIGGPGANQLIGLAGKVKFKPSKATDLIFAGIPRRRTALLNPLPPGGTYYRFVHGHLVPIPASEVKAGDTKANKASTTKTGTKVADVNPGGPMIKANSQAPTHAI